MARSSIGRPCHVCGLPEQQSFEVTARTVRGDTWAEIGAYAGCSGESIRRHAENHGDGTVPKLRAWMARYGIPLKALALERAQVEALDVSDLTRADMARRILGLERAALATLAKLGAGEDLRGSIGAIGELRQLTVVLANLHGLLGPAEPVVVPGFDNPYRGDLLADIKATIEAKVAAAYDAGVMGAPRP